MNKKYIEPTIEKIKIESKLTGDFDFGFISVKIAFRHGKKKVFKLMTLPFDLHTDEIHCDHFIGQYILKAGKIVRDHGFSEISSLKEQYFVEYNVSKWAADNKEYFRKQKIKLLKNVLKDNQNELSLAQIYIKTLMAADDNFKDINLSYCKQLAEALYYNFDKINKAKEILKKIQEK